MDQLITSSYEHKLAAAYHRIDRRGLLINTDKLKKVEEVIKQELADACNFLSTKWNFPVYTGAENNPDPKNKDCLNLGSTEKLLERLKLLGFSVPKIRKKDEETSEYEFKESVNELALRNLFANPSLWPTPDAGEAIKKLLDIREIVTFKNRYVKARLYKDQYFSNYSVTATVTGRRGSKKNIFGLGGNAQNFPARGRLAPLWKECIIARPGKIFFFVDQMQAEDWPVQALAENYTALDEMARGINRHYKFASAIFGTSIDDLKRGRKSGDSKAEMEYALGKRGRHANNYGMQPSRLSEILAGEGYSVPKETCTVILDTINRIDPNVKAIFHKYAQECLMSTRILKTPLGRERQFFGLRANEKNYAVFNEAYSYIPQATVGDNTGLAILYLDSCNDYVLQESHDSITQELRNHIGELIFCFRDTKQSFNRTIKFHNGIEVNIPIEGKLGKSWAHTYSLKEFSEDGLEDAYRTMLQDDKNGINE